MKLKKFLKEEKIKQTTFCKAINVHYQYLSKIVRGERTPSPELAAKIEKETDGKVTFRELLLPEHPNR